MRALPIRHRSLPRNSSLPHLGSIQLQIPMDLRLGIIEGAYTPKLARVLTHGIAVMTEDDAAGFVAEVGLATVSSSTFTAFRGRSRRGTEPSAR